MTIRQPTSRLSHKLSRRSRLMQSSHQRRLFCILIHTAALAIGVKSQKSHQRELVDGSRSSLQRNRLSKFRNPANGKLVDGSSPTYREDAPRNGESHQRQLVGFKKSVSTVPRPDLKQSTNSPLGG